jgi:hypothetical protein
VQLFENFQNSINYLLRYNNNEYLLEGIRKVVEVIIIDEHDDLTKFLPEKK